MNYHSFKNLLQQALQPGSESRLYIDHFNDYIKSYPEEYTQHVIVMLQDAQYSQIIAIVYRKSISLKEQSILSKISPDLKQKLLLQCLNSIASSASYGEAKQYADCCALVVLNLVNTPVIDVVFAFVDQCLLEGTDVVKRATADLIQQICFENIKYVIQLGIDKIFEIISKLISQECTIDLGVKACCDLIVGSQYSSNGLEFEQTYEITNNLFHLVQQQTNQQILCKICDNMSIVFDCAAPLTSAFTTEILQVSQMLLDVNQECALNLFDTVSDPSGELDMNDEQQQLFYSIVQKLIQKVANNYNEHMVQLEQLDDPQQLFEFHVDSTDLENVLCRTFGTQTSLAHQIYHHQRNNCNNEIDSYLLATLTQLVFNSTEWSHQIVLLIIQDVQSMLQQGSPLTKYRTLMAIRLFFERGKDQQFIRIFDKILEANIEQLMMINHQQIHIQLVRVLKSLIKTRKFEFSQIYLQCINKYAQQLEQGSIIFQTEILQLLCLCYDKQATIEISAIQVNNRFFTLLPSVSPSLLKEEVAYFISLTNLTTFIVEQPQNLIDALINLMNSPSSDLIHLLLDCVLENLVKLTIKYPNMFANYLETLTGKYIQILQTRLFGPETKTLTNSFCQYNGHIIDQCKIIYRSLIVLFQVVPDQLHPYAKNLVQAISMRNQNGSPQLQFQIEVFGAYLNCFQNEELQQQAQEVLHIFQKTSVLIKSTKELTAVVRALSLTLTALQNRNGLLWEHMACLVECLQNTVKGANVSFLRFQNNCADDEDEYDDVYTRTIEEREQVEQLGKEICKFVPQLCTVNTQFQEAVVKELIHFTIALDQPPFQFYIIRKLPAFLDQETTTALYQQFTNACLLQMEEQILFKGQFEFLLDAVVYLPPQIFNYNALKIQLDKQIVLNQESNTKYVRIAQNLQFCVLSRLVEINQFTDEFNVYLDNVTPDKTITVRILKMIQMEFWAKSLFLEKMKVLAQRGIEEMSEMDRQSIVI
ncbi:Conserved_hypothetical protein [Hexamita inflata]|uniref:Uncharacterized protein n=1 Tax=Hexamita inflata TaxID=28002 RepID=A0AA86QB17_9EUKA|nr:Conserved hypothetical protein [Hexamita inflata]